MVYHFEGWGMVLPIVIGLGFGACSYSGSDWGRLTAIMQVRIGIYTGKDNNTG